MSQQKKMIGGIKGNILIALLSRPTFKSCSKIAKHIDCTYAYFMRLRILLEIDGLIKTKVIGRRREIYLTAKGEKVATALMELRKYI